MCMSRRGEHVPQQIRNAVAKRDRGICTHCGKRAASAKVSKRGVLQFFDDDGRVFHIDHLVPVSQGGSHELDNVVLSCPGCNMSSRRALAANDPEVKALLAEFS